MDNGTTPFGLVDLAVADGRFTTLVGALQASGLVEALQGDGPFSLFAPTDDAFGTLPAGTLEGLSTEQLANILRKHSVSGKVMAADAIALDCRAVDTLLECKQIAITVEGDAVRINNAAVVIADVGASNSVIHIIDSVLLPPVEHVLRSTPRFQEDQGRRPGIYAGRAGANAPALLPLSHMEDLPGESPRPLP